MSIGKDALQVVVCKYELLANSGDGVIRPLEGLLFFGRI